MSKILLIETSTKTCSVAVSENGSTICIKEHTSENYTHSEFLHVYIQELLNKNDIALPNLDAVCVSKGPGSYTGLRIAVSTAKGLCFGADLKLLSITSLQSLSELARSKYPHYDYYIPMLDARRMEVYTQVFNSKGVAKSDVDAHILDESSYDSFLAKGKCLFFGDGSEKSKELLQNENAFFEDIAPSASGMSELADGKFDSKSFEDVAYFEPFYLKDFVAGKKKQN
ncbi:MAG: tRNA threonylcarbamoyladenosine biosynthesis protein TsaB [Arenicella sp.]|jgi:tRNA threonylcarbamoyladenosine biosynthesis protein TsaB